MLTVSHPQVDHEADEGKKNPTSTKNIGQCIERVVAFQSCLIRLRVDSRTPVRNHLLSVEPDFTWHCVNILFLNRINFKFQKEIMWKLQKKRNRKVDSECIFMHLLKHSLYWMSDYVYFTLLRIDTEQDSATRFKPAKWGANTEI